MEKIEFITRLEKQSIEKRKISVDFADSLDTGVSVSSAAASAINITTGEADNSVLSTTTASASGTTATVMIQAGDHGSKYKVCIVATMSDGQVLREDFVFSVIDL